MASSRPEPTQTDVYRAKLVQREIEKAQDSIQDLESDFGKLKTERRAIEEEVLQKQKRLAEIETLWTEVVLICWNLEGQ